MAYDRAVTEPPRRAVRAAIVLAGLVLPQVLLYGPSLVGQKVLLPLDILTRPNVYLPSTAERPTEPVADFALSDQVLLLEMDRRFAAAEWRAGRVPLWRPSIFAGTPFVAHPKYSPFLLPYYLLPSPITYAWIQLVKAVVAGLGAYLVFRRVMSAGFWPGAFGGWCLPLTGFFVYGLGMPLTFVTACFPWLLLATRFAVRRPGAGGPALALTTALTLVSGQLDMAGLALLGSGLFALWWLGTTYGPRRALAAGARAAAWLALAWALGFLLAAPYILPLLESSAGSFRIIARAAGLVDRPPLGLAALPQMVIPEFFGATRRGSLLLVGANQLENAASAYAGFFATLLLAPLAGTSRRHRPLVAFLAGFGLVTFAWQLDVPGIVALWQASPLRLLSYNRFEFATSFAVLALAVIGLDVVWEKRVVWRRWLWIPVGLVAALGLWCALRATDLPHPVATLDRPDAETIRRSFRHTYVAGTAFSALAIAAWLALRLRPGLPHLAPALALALVADLLWFARGVNPQEDPALYYPRVPALEALAKAPPGRMLCVDCLPPNLAETHGLRDLRGYDALDPWRYVRLLELGRDPRFGVLPWAITSNYYPRLHRDSSGALALPPVLSMLGLRYLVFRGAPPANTAPFLRADDYWVLENVAALPRAFVPRTVQTIPDDRQTLRRLAAPDFDARQVALVERPLTLPEPSAGVVRIAAEIPTEVTLDATMETPGLVVISDLWDPGWRATVGGRPAPILRANFALRGIVVPAGRSTIAMRYEPLGHERGVALAEIGLAGVLIWLLSRPLMARRRDLRSP